MRDTSRSGLLGMGLVLVAGIVAPARAGSDEEGDAAARRDRRVGRGFDVEVRVDGRALPEFYGRGRRYVEAREGAEYELRLTNPTSGRVAVALSVDGLNTIDARRTPPREASQWVILPYQSVTIRGWQVSSERARRFTFTTPSDSYAAAMGETGDVGVISAVVFRERSPAPSPIPTPWPRREGRLDADAPRASARAEAAESPVRGLGHDRPERDAATGIGRSVPYEVRGVAMDLEEWPSAEVTIHYAYRPALVRLGLLPRPDPWPETPRWRDLDDRRFCPEP